jgi:hypothetical protein
MASLPHLVKWHEELSPFGLIVLGPHLQSAKPGEVKAKAEKLGVRFTLTDRGSVSGNESRGIPHCFLFDHTGKSVFEGHPTKVEQKLREAVGAAIVDGAEATNPPKALTQIVEVLRRGQPPLQSVQKLLTLQRSTDAPTASAAKALVTRILDGGQKRLDAAKELVATDAVTAYETAVDLSTSFKGTPLAPKATELVNKLKVDKVVQAELKARPSLAKIHALEFAMANRPTEEDVKSAEFKKKFAAVLKQMNSTLMTMKRNWPDAKATKEAIEICEEYEVMGK